MLIQWQRFAEKQKRHWGAWYLADPFRPWAGEERSSTCRTANPTQRCRRFATAHLQVVRCLWLSPAQEEPVVCLHYSTLRFIFLEQFLDNRYKDDNYGQRCYIQIHAEVFKECTNAKSDSMPQEPETISIAASPLRTCQRSSVPDLEDVGSVAHQWCCLTCVSGTLNQQGAVGQPDL